MRVILTGATGFIGNRLLQFLLAEGCDVVACVRNPARIRECCPDVTAIAMDFTAPPDPQGWREILRGADVVINTVGIFVESGRQTFQQLHVDFPQSLLLGCQSAGVPRFLQVSALGTGADAPSGYFQSKHLAETMLRKVPLEAAIIKPSLVYGPGGKSMALFSALASLPVHVLPQGGEQRVQPVHVDDVCAAITALAKAPELPCKELQAVGPEPMTFAQMLAGYRRWLGFHRSVPVIALPGSLAMLAARFGTLTGNAWLRVDSLKMLELGNTASAEAMTRILERSPLTLQQGLHRQPATAAERWHASLFLLVPTMRWAIAFMWVFAGVTSAFLYPVADSLSMLQQVGFNGRLAQTALYSAAVLDILLGIAVLLRYRPALTGLVQLAVIFSYTLLISLHLPEFWLHPFGPIVKNIPVAATILILMATERR